MKAFRQRSRSRRGQRRQHLPSPFAAREARLLARLKAVTREIAANLPKHELRHLIELVVLAFCPQAVPGVPPWAQKAARRVFNVDQDFPRPVPFRSAAEATAAFVELQRKLTAELEAQPALWGGCLGLTFRAVDDFAESAAETVARRRLERLQSVCDAAKRLESDKAARLDNAKESEFLTMLGAGMSTDTAQLLREGNSYHDLDGIVATRWREVMALASRGDFCQWLDQHYGHGMARTEKRLEHFCRLIGLRFRPPGRPTGSTSQPTNGNPPGAHPSLG